MTACLTEGSINIVRKVMIGMKEQLNIMKFKSSYEFYEGV